MTAKRLYMVPTDKLHIGEVTITALLPATLLVEGPDGWDMVTTIEEPPPGCGDDYPDDA